jgi:hypothetical protein
VRDKGGEKVKKTAIIVAVAVLAFTLLLVAPVYATKPTQISGTWGPTSGMTLIGPEHTAGGNHFDAFTNTGKYLTGPITGTFEQTVTLTFHTGEPVFVEEPPLGFLWRIDRTIDATVDGKSGTVVMRLLCKGTATATGTSLEGTWVIISATDGLAGLHGQGTWWNLPPTMKLGYEGQIHFDP